MSKKIDLSKIETGTEFSCYIDGIPVTGKIYNCKRQGCIYLCQNLRDGASSPNKLGYKYSYFVDYRFSHRNHGISLLKLGKPSKNFPIIKPFKIAGYTAYFKKSYLKVGCQIINKKLLQEIFNEAKQLKIIE